MLHILRQIVWPTLITPGLYAPKLSLTAHDGRWVRSEDYLNQFICLIFFRECNEQTASWLKEFESINALDDSHVFAITASKPETLRKFSNEHQLSMLMLTTHWQSTLVDMVPVVVGFTAKMLLFASVTLEQLRPQLWVKQP